MRFLRRLAKPFVAEANRQLCFRGWREARFETEVYGWFQFLCANRIEYYRTVQFGGGSGGAGSVSLPSQA